MKKWVVAAVVSCIFLITLSTGCNNTIKSKELIVTNSSSYPITFVSIDQHISKKTLDSLENALANGEIIAEESSKTFNIAPYSSSTNLKISNNAQKSIDQHLYFTYDYLLEGNNEAITATFNGTGITVSGSNATPVT